VTNKRHVAGVVLLSLALLALLGGVDLVTGRHLGLFVFYFIPVAVVAWTLGRTPGLATAAAAAACWMLVDGLSHQTYLSVFYLLWNAGIRLVSFVFVAFSVTTIRRMLEQERALAHELQAALDEVKVLKGLLPICAACKKIRNKEGRWEQLEAYLATRSEVEFTHSICPACARALYPEIALGDEEPSDPERTA
jgi:hypothetical protein